MEMGESDTVSAYVPSESGESGATPSRSELGSVKIPTSPPIADAAAAAAAVTVADDVVAVPAAVVVVDVVEVSVESDPQSPGIRCCVAGVDIPEEELV